MMSEISNAFSIVLAGSNYRIVQLEHKWIDLFLQNYDGKASLLIREAFAPDFYLEEGRGYTVQKEQSGNSCAVRLTSRDVGANAIFVRLVDFLVEKTSQANSKSEALSQLQNTIREFKYFSSRKGGLLSIEQIRGLFAELLVLRRLLKNGTPPQNALSIWKGPHASEGIGLHDFVFPSGDALEVKSSSHPSSEIRVSSPLQLAPTEQSLFLVVVPIEAMPASTGYGISIQELVNQCSALIGRGDQYTQGMFSEALASVGFDKKDDYYLQWKFQDSDWKSFKVREGFPYLDLKDIPRAITKVQYSLELALLSGFEVQTPAAISEDLEGEDGDSRL